MVTIGSNLNSQLAYEASLAQGAFEDAHKKSADLKTYNKALNNAVKLFTQALSDKNISVLFELEKTAQKFDLGRTGGGESRTHSFSALETMRNNWVNMQDPVFAKEHFANAHKVPPTKPVRDTSMNAGIQSQCRKLGTLASGLATPAEQAFYLKRQECLKFIGKEHNLTINQHLGLGKGKEISR